jgi:hypothetical protein
VRLLKAFVAGCALVLFARTSAFAASDDSLIYAEIRARVAAQDSASQALAPADALAQAGLYGEAIEILREVYAPVAVTPDTAASRPRIRSTQWRLSSGLDYYHLEDIDTVAMTPEELRDYKRLTETPLSAWLRTKAAIKPATDFIDEITPQVYVSERKGRVETSARLSSFGGLVRYEPSVKAEKWFRTNASDSSFKPTDGQPSDMGGAALRMTVGNASRLHRRLEWEAPLSIDWEHFRIDRSGYESMVEYRFMPAIQLSAESLPLRGRFSAQAEYEDFYRAMSDNLDVLRISGRAEGYATTAKFNLMLTGAWMGDRYLHARDQNPAVIDRFEGVFRGEYKAVRFLTGKIRMRAIHEIENYAALPGAMAFAKVGSDLTLEPAIETSIGGKMKISPELLCERRFADLSEDGFLWEARSAWEPGMRISWNSEIFEAAVRGAFRLEDIKKEFEIYNADSRSFRGAADLSIHAGRLLTINLFADYQYRVYPAHARVSENLTVSAAVTVRL